MDPSRAPDFRPPSTVPTNSPQPPLAPRQLIPQTTPIQPPVLADYPNQLDAPIKPRHHRHKQHPRTNKMHKVGYPDVVGSVPGNNRDLMPLSSNENSESEEEEEEAKEKEYAATEIQKDEEWGLQDDMTATVPKILSHQTADLEEVPLGITRQAKSLQDYTFPMHRLSPKLSNPNKHPLVIVACGSFSPITYLHLRMFEMAVDAIREQTRFEVIGGYYSPVSDHYSKRGLAPARHRVRMCELACERTSSWLMVDAWESLQPQYTRTAKVLDHFNEELNVKRGGILTADGTKRGVKIMLLAGGDLIESMGEPNVWADDDLHHILGNYGCLIVERTGSDVRSFLLSHDIMYEHRRNVLVIKQLIYNDISSTKVRLFLRRGMSVQYLLPNSVIRYIQEHRLYVNEPEPVKQVLESKD